MISKKNNSYKMDHEQPAGSHRSINSGRVYCNSIGNSKQRPTNLKPRNFLISSYNVRTLCQTGKFHQLCNGCSKHKLDFVAIQEHRWITESEYDQIWNDNHTYKFIFA